MKKFIFSMVVAVFAFISVLGMGVQAASVELIPEGIYAKGISLGNMTADEARAAVEDYVGSLSDSLVTFLVVDDQEVTVTAGELGISWANPEIIEEALAYGKGGNVVARYKLLKDLSYENYVYPIRLDFDINAINSVVVEKCASLDREAVNFHLKKVDGEFIIEDGQTGFVTDVEKSIDVIYEALTNNWSDDGNRIALEVVVDEPQGSEEELAKVKDILGTYTTSFSTSNGARSGNVRNGCQLIDGTTLYPGEEFSTYQAVAPFSESNGYYMAGSYLNGKVVDSLGGGICQVSSTLYNAALLSELDITERHNHSMIVSYVPASADAAIAESAGKDFKFINNTDYPIYIEGYTTPDKHITFTIYGVETRDATREVSYASEILETINPDTEVIYADASLGIGHVNVQSAHIGYKARLWKVVKENGVEVSRTQVNSSSYKMSPRSAIVGVATDNPEAYEAIMAAIATNSIDHVKGVAAAYAPQPVVTQTPPAEVPQ